VFYLSDHKNVKEVTVKHCETDINSKKIANEGNASEPKDEEEKPELQNG
jgi:hypothetical protein